MTQEIDIPLDLKRVVLMGAEETIGGRPATITKEDGKIKIIFHPLAKDAKHPKANVFTVKLAKADLEKIKKAF